MVNNIFINKKLKKEKKNDKQLNDKFLVNKPGANKFCSFLKHSLLPNKSRYKFEYVLNNNKLSSNYKLKQPEENYIYRLTNNEKVSYILYSIFFSFYFIYIYIYEEEALCDLLDENRDNFIFLFDYSILYYFLNMALYELYIYNIDLRFLIYAYSIDKKYYDNYFLLFNYFIYLYVLNFFVLLNIGLIKLEHDKVLTPIEKWDDIPKMDIDFFDYSEFIDYNISDDTILYYNDNIFFSFCIYEFYLDFTFYFCNIFNIDFFHKSIFKKKRKKKKYIYRNYLSKTAYNEALVSENENQEETFNEGYDEFSLINNDSNKLDYYNNMMDRRSFMIKVPYLFFLMYSWYIIYYKNARYNLYVRSYAFFEEYTCKKKYFILHNNPHGKNKTKISFFRYQKMWTIDHFMLYIEERFFNKWLLFYSTQFFNLKKIIINESSINLYSFNILFENSNLDLLLKINALENLEYIYEFYYSSLLDIMDLNRTIEGYRLIMKTRITKYSRKFKFGTSSFLDIDELVEKLYTMPIDILFYYSHMNKMMSFDLMLNIYNEKFINYFFFKDFCNFNNKVDIIKNNKMVNLYNKLIYLSFYMLDPFFFHYFWRKFFPKKISKLKLAYAYLKIFLIQVGIRKNNIFNISNYNFFCHYLNWRTDTSTFAQQNNFYKDGISACLSISNMVTKSRYLELLNKLKFILNINNIYNIQKLQHFIFLLKNFYIALLNENIDFILYVFLNDVDKFFNIQNNTSNWLPMHNIIDNTILYRYYVCVWLFEFNHYTDWFKDKNKRGLWIFHKKDYAKHEGILFYKKVYNEIY